jgi:hypothetical protein
LILPAGELFRMYVWGTAEQVRSRSGIIAGVYTQLRLYINLQVSLLYIRSGIKGETDTRKFNNERETRIQLAFENQVSIRTSQCTLRS